MIFRTIINLAPLKGAFLIFFFIIVSMAINDKEELFEKTPVPKAVAKLAIPTMIASIVMVIYSLADTFFVGLLNDPISTSAVTLASPVVLLFNAVTNLFGVGSSSKMSRALGVKDYDTVKKTSAFGIYSGLLSGVLFSLVATFFMPGLLVLLGADASTSFKTEEYLFWTVTCGAIPSIINVIFSNVFRAEGSTTHASIGVMSGCILNIILDPIFIMPWGLNMGAAGAGCATFISNTVACVYFLILLVVKRGKTFVTVNPKMFIPTKDIVKEVFGVGVPASIQNILNVIGSTILNNLAAVYGPEAVSAIGITHKLSMVPLYFSMGGGQGIMPLIGYNFASGNSKRMKDTIKFAEKILVAFMSVAAVLFIVFSKQLVSCFMENQTIVEYGSGFLKGFSLASPFLAFDFLGVAVFQACGMGKTSLFFAIARKILLEIPATILLNSIFGMYGMAYGQFVAEFILAIVAFFTVEKIINKPLNNKQSA